MNPALIAALLSATRPVPVSYIDLKPKMEFTRYLFGPLTEIEGKRLRVLEKNSEGDCLCLIDDAKGQRLVDVDHRDIKS
jgi:hypothetical protein